VKTAPKTKFCIIIPESDSDKNKKVVSWEVCEGGKVAYIEGNRGHHVSKVILCVKGSAGIMQVNAP